MRSLNPRLNEAAFSHVAHQRTVPAHAHPASLCGPIIRSVYCASGDLPDPDFLCARFAEKREVEVANHRIEARRSLGGSIGRLDQWERCLIKRVFDIAFSVAALLLLAPLILVVVALVRWKLGSPILFRQARPGRHGEIFELIKFRTMHDAQDETGAPLPDAERITQLGSSLRRTSIDELPELWNVLKGDMSLVGPRPLLKKYLPLYSAEQRRRHELKPGITGWAQVNGRNAISWEEKLKFDIWYVDNQSLLLDLRILFMTIRSVLAREGIDMKAHASAEESRGGD